MLARAEGLDRGHEELITLRAVRRLAEERGIPARDFLGAYRDSFRLAVARLVQALYRERLCVARATSDARLGPCIILGRPVCLLIPIVPRAFTRLEVLAWPPCYRPGRSGIAWSGAFQRQLCRALAHGPLASLAPALVRDFRNSLANLVLNLLLGRQRGVARRTLEPAYQGHHYYPLPALRIGPSIPQILACSHLSTSAVPVPLLELSALAFHSTVFSSARQCLQTWSGLSPRTADRMLPVHPWQLAISPVVAALVEANGARVTRVAVPCLPLASQRTLRVLATGYDIKLAVDASVTSEHRLLYRLNLENAPAISALVLRLLGSAGRDLPFAVQPDVASMSFADAGVAAHLSAIVRAPLVTRRGERAIPAIELWTGRELALRLLRGANRGDVSRFFRGYCRIMMRGPVAFLLRFGLAFEPHLQNSIIVLRGRTPVRLILRDLDGTMMQPDRVAPLLAAHGIELVADTWQRMPAAEVGEHRLVHALFFAHLATVSDFLVTRCRGSETELLRILAQEWRSLGALLGLPKRDTRFDALCAHLEKGKSMLMARLAQTANVNFVELPRAALFERQTRPFWRELARAGA